MNRLLQLLFSFSILAVTTFSCNQSTRSQSNDAPEDVVTDVVEPIATDYNPGEDWELVWADEFTASTINPDNWNLQLVNAGRFNDEWQRYTDSGRNAYIDSGHLVISANHESETHGMDQYTSARLNTANKQTWTYGKIAARIRLPQGQGIWPAFWMLGANINENGGDTPWPQCGEIDILELYGSKDDGVVEGNLHYANDYNEHRMSGAIAYELEDGIFADDFHVFALEWTADSITWLVDEQQYASVPITAYDMTEFHHDYFILLNLAVGGTYAGRPDATTRFPQRMYVDWVRVYQ